MKTFAESGLAPFLLEGLAEINIKIPTPIQQQAIPLQLAGYSVVGESQTGTGKTLAYLLPLLQEIHADASTTQALILAPTRELTVQIRHVLEALCRGTNIRFQIIMGGVDIKRQIEKLKQKPHIIIGSPGRIYDLIEKKKLKVHEVKRLVIDEADQMLESGAVREVEAVMQRTPRTRKLSVFSATISPMVEEWGSKWTEEELKVIKIQEKSRLPKLIEHYFIVTPEREKFETLRRLLQALQPERALIFVKKLHLVGDIANWLAAKEVAIAGIHSETKKAEREQAMNKIRKGELRYLVTTDLLARGLDIDDVTHVINFDLPFDADGYIHRAGRTGRAGKGGMAVTLLEPKEKFMAGKLAKQLHIEIQEQMLFRGELVPPKKPSSRPPFKKKPNIKTKKHTRRK
ncbi:DEAD/DEAH box helicase [Aneurinibacillus aneurinilyticus]|uniref:DEAD/DEAH box helicase n=2 Tax=Aneurinibacillus aneurinilyticus TaxID=1391 RepID=A0A848CR35_ANEAE|nr:DEAD/DEAH box helicase [Aneurinibacillus aneurinilyticus]ERI10058.1 putative DEAD-box ATP-dependent RNA helicase CshB [Aneurinibacillus aneurinilyticus ATCC 12856]MED0708097.1 DEAD/DEAH box helicase [Aneurinibacillus aneurinilyticus]MED0726029.1 DEAD/DEAH box helicase [Aneurinibacillus aneurinilyticus]MED0732389.1 DEAD/DEAH box helicase [Aneurinibacillus aneurinilyticus]MED0741136.1 DEAD/DEAH box helicase [Aneurinibacillus aneurinilyticus]